MNHNFLKSNIFINLFGGHNYDLFRGLKTWISNSRNLQEVASRNILKQFISINNNFGVGMRSFINESEMERFSAAVAELSNLQQILELNEEKYQANLNKETPTSIACLIQKINERERRKGLSNQKVGQHQFWVFGERKVFCWVLVLYTHLNNITLQQMNDTHFRFLQNIFMRRTIDFLKYEITSIIRAGERHKDAWAEDEIQLLTQIVEESSQQSRSNEEKYDWRHISFRLFCQSKGTFYKPLQDCREKWSNYLNPRLNKEKWTLAEDVQLFEIIEKEGCKWALISRKFQLNRTEHMVKNRYNAYIKNWRAKRSSIKSKKGLNNRILHYLKTRLNKKRQISSNQQQERPTEELLEDCEKANEYDIDLQAQEEEAVGHYQLPIAHNLVLRHAYDLDKQEKKTADSDAVEVQSYIEDNLQMNKAAVFEGVTANFAEDELELEAFNYGLILNSLDEIDFRRQGKEEMRLIEAEVAEALGCSHFERALEYDCNEFQACESFSWL